MCPGFPLLCASLSSRAWPTKAQLFARCCLTPRCTPCYTRGMDKNTNANQEAPKNDFEYVSNETAYGVTIGYPFAIKVF